jgi:hypothetical protein
MNISAKDAIPAASPEWGGRLKIEPNGPYPAKGIKYESNNQYNVRANTIT